MPDPKVTELLERAYTQGTIVVNCVGHSPMKITERPIDCRLCRTDQLNTLRRALAANEWLNQWKDDAAALLAELSDG